MKNDERTQIRRVENGWVVETAVYEFCYGTQHVFTSPQTLASFILKVAQEQETKEQTTVMLNGVPAPERTPIAEIVREPVAGFKF